MTDTDPDFAVVEITPDMAESFIGRNTHNRPVRQRIVDAYAADMTNGDWRWNGEGIKFDTGDVLLDGQHRLLAIVQSGQTIRMPVFRGLPPETQETMDGGAKRKFSDVLALRGEQSYVALASIARLVYRWDTGERRVGSGNRLVTNAMLTQTIEKHPELRPIAVAAVRDAGRCALPGSILGLARWLFEGIDPDDAFYFFERLTDDGSGHQRGEPIFELRRTLENSKSVRGERNLTWLLAVTIKAWNAYRDHGNKAGTVGLYRYRQGGANPEPFPEPR